MAARNVAVRLAVVDGQKVKAELTEVGEAGQKALTQIEQSSGPASAGLDKVARSAETAGRAAPALGDLSVMMAGFVGGLAAGAVNIASGWLAQLPQVFGNILRTGEEAAESQRRLETALRVTGNTSGLTAQQLLDFSDQQEAATLDTAESIQDAAAILATFKSVSGDTFTRTISLAQDMSTVFKTDLKSSITQLGKALEDPINGLTSLRRIGVSFTDEQKEMIKVLDETGRKFEAQQAILTAIEQQGILGQAAAQAEGVTGASNRLADAWGNMLEAIGQTDAVTSLAGGAFRGLASLMEGVTANITGQANSIEERLKRAKETLAGIQDYKSEHPILSRFGLPGAERAAESQVRALEGPAAANAQISSMLSGMQERFAREAAERQQIEIKTNAVLQDQANIEKEIGKLKKDSGEKAAQALAELERNRTRLENQRTPETSESVDKALAQAEELYRRKKELIDEEARRAQEAEARKGESAARAIERERDARARATERQRQEEERNTIKQITSTQTLQDAYTQLAGTQIENIDLVLKRQLEANDREIKNIELREAADVAATQRAELEKKNLRETTLLAAGKEVSLARIGAAESRARDPARDEEERTAAAREGMELRIQLEREETAQRLANLQLVGLSEQDYAIAREAYLMASEERIQEIVAKTSRQREDDGITAEKAATTFSRTISSGLTELVMQGKEGFSNLSDAFQTFLDGMQRQLVQTGIEAAIGTTGKGGAGGSGILGMIFGAATTAGTSYATGGAGGGASGSAGGSGIQGWNAQWAHTGSPGVAIHAPAELWAGAPRYHTGHTPPALAPWERAAIITKDETVSTPSQMAAMRAPINVTINNHSSEPVNTREDGQGGMQIDIGNVVANTLSKPGSPARQMLRGIIQSEMRSGA